MGCWYETCGFSHLPIPPETPCLLFLLKPGSSMDDGRSGFCYATGLWSPACLPLRGKYNDDRGTLDLGKCPAHWDLSKEFLNEAKLVWADDRYDESKEPKPVLATYDKKFFEKVERGYITASSGHWRKRQPNGTYSLGQMLVRQDVWDFCLGYTFKNWWSEECSRETNRAHAKELIKYIDKNPPTDLSSAFDFERDFADKYPSSFSTVLFRSGSDLSFSRFGIRLVGALARKEIETEKALQILYEIGDVAHVNTLMTLLRRAWQPQPGKGSQDIEWDLHADFTKKVLDIATKERDTEE